MADKANEALGTDRPHFDLLMNAAGDVMIAFNATTAKPKDALFVFDGRSRAILYKTKKEPIAFSPLPKEAQDALSKAKDILCVEVKSNKIVAEYNAKVEVRK